MNFDAGTYHESLGRPVRLTPREEEVISGMIGDLRDSEIAERLGISRRTVNQHAGNILQKYGVRTRAGAVARWLIAGGVVLSCEEAVE